MAQLLLASTSTVYGSPYLSYLKPDIVEFFDTVQELVFIPYARPNGISHDAYTAIAAEFFASIGIAIRGLHTASNPQDLLEHAQGIFTGGGNTFLLLKMLYEQDLMQVLRSAVHLGARYMGTSAGSNIAGESICTTNDMPIVYPPTFQAMGSIPYNINPHYLDPDPGSVHMGETRETRIKEFHTQQETPVIGLREGSYLRVTDQEIILKGPLAARYFEPGKSPEEKPAGSIFPL
ncbi:MAG: dipeptidase PepE [Weeksellaceae bacterium]|nr:dipeptidase PepE [Weeksellaceae bacterium]